MLFLCRAPAGHACFDSVMGNITAWRWSKIHVLREVLTPQLMTKNASNYASIVLEEITSTASWITTITETTSNWLVQRSEWLP